MLIQDQPNAEVLSDGKCSVESRVGVVEHSNPVRYHDIVARGVQRVVEENTFGVQPFARKVRKRLFHVRSMFAGENCAGWGCSVLIALGHSNTTPAFKERNGASSR